MHLTVSQELRNNKSPSMTVARNSVIFCILHFSYDVVFTAGADVILSKFLDFESRVVFSAEGFCWPDQSLAVSLSRGFNP